MVLKFDDLIYKKTFEIEAKDQTFDITVCLSDEDTEKLKDLIIAMMLGKNTLEDIDRILFKENLDKIKKVLIGFNFEKFRQVVLSHFQDFMVGSIEESTKKVKSR